MEAMGRVNFPLAPVDHQLADLADHLIKIHVHVNAMLVDLEYLYKPSLCEGLLLGDIIQVQQNAYENIDLGPAGGRAITGFLCPINPSNYPNIYSGASYLHHRTCKHFCSNANWLNLN